MHKLNGYSRNHVDHKTPKLWLDFMKLLKIELLKIQAYEFSTFANYFLSCIVQKIASAVANAIAGANGDLNKKQTNFFIYFCII